MLCCFYVVKLSYTTLHVVKYQGLRAFVTCGCVTLVAIIILFFWKPHGQHVVDLMLFLMLYCSMQHNMCLKASGAVQDEQQPLCTLSDKLAPHLKCKLLSTQVLTVAAAAAAAAAFITAISCAGFGWRHCHHPYNLPAAAPAVAAVQEACQVERELVHQLVPGGVNRHYWIPG
jgi:hypothetical protein